ncbi:copper amine oxidase [Paenibacillus sp. UMB7766-LJ446]|uniref:copper amine oxidase n=1 Tax=Paenibacillus sp. UMB7766-LJ446 TaxID=3046313 RepID=UPI00254D1475|nr:copper amine oxidase [Paenibacillus sp. UMB7766-LJ446]MDK8188767.1 copper amine oxidase [Paenibacillus sp. UMB7766-LJ446]
MKKFAHKVAYIAGGIIIGVVFSTSAGAFADTVKSMVGKKVTGEYTIVVDGKKLSDKGSVIDSRANVPARSLSDALGADVKVSGKTITITSGEESATATETTNSSNIPNGNNSFEGKSKAYLESMKKGYTSEILPPLVAGLEKVTKEYEGIKAAGDEESTRLAKQKVDEYQKLVDDAQAELKLIDEALLTAK